MLKIFSKKNIITKADGFTLIEILAAIAIIAIGILATLSVTIVNIKGNAQSRNMSIATNLAQDHMETILNTTYGSITLTNPIMGTYTEFTDYRESHSLMVTIEDDTPDANIKTVTVKSFWSPATATSNHYIELKSIIAQ